jgi:hypothetical protein
MSDQMITDVNVHTKYNFSSFSIFLKRINCEIHKLHYLKVNLFNFSHLWDPGSGQNSSRILGLKKHRIPDPDPQHCCLIMQTGPGNLFPVRSRIRCQAGPIQIRRVYKCCDGYLCLNGSEQPN